VVVRPAFIMPAAKVDNRQTMTRIIRGFGEVFDKARPLADAA
jgi:hypothetical protein